MIKIFKDLRHSLFYAVLMRTDIPLLGLGDASTGCEWTFCPTVLSRESIVYSGGVGRDITFEHALADRFGCRIWLFDPSPTGLETMEEEANRREGFHFRPVGLAATSGPLILAPPQNEEEGSWFAADGANADHISVPCRDLKGLMDEDGIDHIDLLKLDIEGAEYGVLDDLLARKIRVDQICVEYHHGMLPGIRRSQTISSVLRLIRAGYVLIFKVGNNHTFLHRRLLARAKARA